MKAIIVAAGMSNRLRPLTNDGPKCMLDLGGKTILGNMLDVLKQNGINDISIIRGYKKEKISYPGVKYYENTDYQNNNILKSLFCAEPEMDGDFLFSYSDIVYGDEIVRKLLENKADIAIVVDVDWKKGYEGRTLHPVTEAELVMAEDCNVTKIGKGLDPARAYGEFIGLGIFSGQGVKLLKKIYSAVKERFKNRQFHDAVSVKKAYVTDMLQELVDRGAKVRVVDISGGWHEVDTSEDLERARAAWSTRKERNVVYKRA